MGNRQSVQQREVSALVAAASDRHFLQLPFDIRCIIYRHAGIISPKVIRHLESWIRNNGDRIPQLIPRRFLRISPAVSADVLAVFWSENGFRLHSAGLVELLKLGNPRMWSSLRKLTVVLNALPPGSKANVGNFQRLRSWRRLCINLGRHLPSSQLTLCFYLHEPRVPGRDHVSFAKSALRSMRKLPLLKRVLIEIHPRPIVPFEGVELHCMATRILNRLSTERRSGHFRFMDLPTEIQIMILGELLVAPGCVIPSQLKGYALFECYAGRCPRGYCWEKTSYDSSKICRWSLPADLLLVNRHISMMSADIFFSRNKFVVDVQHAVPLPQAFRLIWSPGVHTSHDVSSPRIPSLWYPERSQFLRAFPPACIPILQSLRWCFPMCGDQVALSEELEVDWLHTVKFIALNVRPLSRLTITMDMWERPQDMAFPARRFVARDRVMLPLRKLRGLRDLCVYLSEDRALSDHAAEELRLVRLAMGKKYHPTREELEMGSFDSLRLYP